MASSFLFRRSWILLCAGVFAGALSLSAQVNQGPTTIRTDVHHDLSLPLRELAKTAPPLEAGTKHEAEPVRRLPLYGGILKLEEDPVRQASVPFVPNSPVVSQSFEGLGQGQYGFTVQYAPPDTNGAVGATQYVQWVNTYFIVFDKITGTVKLGPVAGNTLWQGFGGGCQTNNNGDPVVQYDKLANRWVMSQFSVSTTPYLQCVAVSQTSDATGAWYRYAFSYGTTMFDDYPKMGIWPDAYYETFNMFQNGQSFVGADACAYDRTRMLAGLSATQVCFQQNSSVGGLLPADLDGTTAPPAGSPNYMLYRATNSTLGLFKFHVDFATPANSKFTGPVMISVAASNALCGGGTCVPQKGTTNTLDSLADRLMYRLAYRNFGNHESLVVNHSVVAGSSGGVRWYEIQNPSGTPVVAQQSTYAPDSNYRWMGSVAMDKDGNLALGYSKSSSTVYPSIAFAGRLSTDPVNTLQAETDVVAGTGYQSTGLTRWGDYSALTVDPVDDCTFWYTQEYMKTNGTWNWNTRIANFKFASCGSAVVLNPTSLAFADQIVGTTSSPQGITLTNNQNTVLTGISISISGDFGQTNNCGTSLPANGGSCTINVTFTPTATGSRSGVLTVSDSAGTQTANLGGNGVSGISLNPPSLTFATQPVGNTSSPQTATLANGSPNTLTNIVVSITGTNPGDFAAANHCGTSLSPNTSCTIDVTFTPSASGSRTATLTVTDSAGTQTTALSGTGADNVPPTTQITAPLNGATVKANFTVKATSSDNVAVTALQIFIDDVLVKKATTATTTFTWITTNYSNGTHTLYSKAFDAAGNVGTSPTVTVTVSNTTNQLINNSGFETGNLTGWSAGGTNLPVVATGYKHTGYYSARLGLNKVPEVTGDSWVYQTVTIPSTATVATLSFWYLPFSSDTISSDWQEAQIQDVNGVPLAQIMKVASNTKVWTQVTYDLLPFKGQTIRILFNDHQTANTKLTWMWVDDVTVKVQ